MKRIQISVGNALRGVLRMSAVLPSRDEPLGAEHGSPDRHRGRSLQGTSRFGVVSRPGRFGGTLIEVLIALLIMGIGVVSAATMFPIAVLRTVQATQLTRATVLRYNAETQLDLHPQLIDHASPPNPVPGPGNRIPLPAPGKVTTAVVDPLGYYLVGDRNNNFRTNFGADQNGNSLPNLLNRVNVSGLFGPPGAPTSPIVIGRVERLVMLPDSWSVQLNDTPDTASPPTATSFTFPPTDGTLLGGLPGILASGGKLRITLFHSSGRTSVVRTVTSLSGNTVNWMLPLPPEYTPPATKIERAVIETRNRHYTWMMTVRKDRVGFVNIDVVVFFNRSFEPLDEAVYTTVAANARPNAQFRITVSAAGPRPLLKRGGFLLDPDTTRWYRIAKIEDEQTLTPRITLTRTPINPVRRVISMAGVISVYPIHSRVVP